VEAAKASEDGLGRMARVLNDKSDLRTSSKETLEYRLLLGRRELKDLQRKLKEYASQTELISSGEAKPLLQV
jgi:hypothetical protein